MADIAFVCPKCQQHLESSPDLAGQLLDCPGCGQPIEVPYPKKPTPPVPPTHRPSPAPRAPTPPPTVSTSPSDRTLASPPTKACPFCGEAILSNAKKCKHCGEFLDGTHAKTTTDLAPSSNTVRVLVTSIVLAAVLCGGGYYFYSSVKDEKEAKQAEATAITYRKRLALTADLILLACADCTRACSSISEEWKDHINDEVHNKYYSGDLNSRLREIIQARESSLDSTHESIESSVRQLSQPPESFAKAHAAFASLYGIYAQLYESATDPSGSYNSYCELVNGLNGKLTQATSEFKALLP